MTHCVIPLHCAARDVSRSSHAHTAPQAIDLSVGASSDAPSTDEDGEPSGRSVLITSLEPYAAYQVYADQIPPLAVVGQRGWSSIRIPITSTQTASTHRILHHIPLCVSPIVEPSMMTINV